MYEELLTQAEIQGNINKVNSRYHAKVIVLIGVLFLTFCNANKSGRQFPCFSGVFLVVFGVCLFLCLFCSSLVNSCKLNSF